jgi:hypothetical protein
MARPEFPGAVLELARLDSLEDWDFDALGKPRPPLIHAVEKAFWG